MQGESEAWAVCTTSGDVEHVTERDEHDYPGFDAGDDIVMVRKFEPISPGSSVFEATTKASYVDVCDLRAILDPEVEFVRPKGRSAADPVSRGG